MQKYGEVEEDLQVLRDVYFSTGWFACLFLGRQTVMTSLQADISHVTGAAATLHLASSARKRWKRTISMHCCSDDCLRHVQPLQRHTCESAVQQHAVELQEVLGARGRSGMGQLSLIISQRAMRGGGGFFFRISMWFAVRGLCHNRWWEVEVRGRGGPWGEGRGGGGRGRGGGGRRN